MTSLALDAYAFVTRALAPLAPWHLSRRARRGKEDPERLGERLGRAGMRRPRGPLIWLHGASVGETLSFLPLVEALSRQRPDLTLLVTSGTVTSAFLLARRLPRGVLHQYAPIDTPAAAAAFLAHWGPSAALLVESELWPNLLRQAKARGVRLALLGARMSHASAKGWARAPGAARALLGGFDLILAQDGLSRARIEALGGEVQGELDLKKAGEPLPCDDAELARLKAGLGGRQVVVAASTHAGEEEIVAGAVAKLGAPRPLLVLAPRHPDRGEAIGAALQALGLVVARRSLGEPLTPQVQAYVADTLGEMGLIFRLADVVVMGGSLTGGVGGHNPMEPARLGLPIVTGPDTANAREAFDSLQREGAAAVVADPDALASLLGELLARPDAARAMGRNAQAVSARGDEALRVALAALEPLLPAPAP